MEFLVNRFNDSLLIYPRLVEYPLLVGNKSLIFFPIFSLGTPISVIAINSRVHLEEEDSLNVFLSAVASVFSMYFYRNLNSSKNSEAHETARKKLLPSIGFEESLSLTDRQLVILRLISEDRTNKSISEFLGYSESTVRQDIMKIFANLGCTHRSEASTLYRDYSSKHLV
jgi:DNA-binding CsgD family transcriptional regulator